MNSLKSMDKKYLYIIGGIFGVLILIIIIVALARGCSGPSNDYEKTEGIMIDAATKYFNSKKVGKPKEFESKEVNVKELTKAGYMDDLSDYLEDTSCTGKVVAYNHGGQILYTTDLECSEYKTKHLSDVIIKDNLVDNVVDGEYQSGIYKVNDTYVFKGSKPNNYVKFGNLMWRIIDINDEGTIRMVRTESEDRTSVWDNKFNSEVSKTYGINDYKNSSLLELMNSNYKKYKDANKLHIAPHTVCVGKRASLELKIDRENIDCAETLDNQYISVISSSDFSNASLDENCDDITNGACHNYNYMSSIITSTWTTTAVNYNTYNVVFISGGIAQSMKAVKSTDYNIVIAIRGDEKYISGKGTSSNPYIIGESK